MFKKVSVLILSLFVSACGLAPGMKMDTPPTSSYYEQSKLKLEPRFVLITPELMASMPALKKDEYYYVAPEDVLSIMVWNHPEFGNNGTNSSAASQSVSGASGQSNILTDSVGALTQMGTNAGSNYLINPDGDIFFPLIGHVHVGGETVDQVRVQITSLLSRYVHNPQVDVRVATFRSHKIYVMGEVKQAGLQNITDIPISITDAITLAGGLNVDTADPGQIYVIRNTGNMLKPTVYWLNAQSPNAMLLGERFRLESNDIIFVSTADVSRWNRAISQIMPTIQTVFYTQASIAAFHNN